MSWKCKQCGDCCKFIVIPVEKDINIETIGYLEAHGIAYGDGKLVVPAQCKYLQRIPGIPRKYNCMIHDNPFVNCRLAGKKECEKCKEEKKCLQKLNNL